MECEILDPRWTLKYDMMFNPEKSKLLETHLRQVPKYVKHKYIVHMNILFTHRKIVCETLKIEMRQKSTKRQAKDNLMKLHNQKFYTPNMNEIK